VKLKGEDWAGTLNFVGGSEMRRTLEMVWEAKTWESKGDESEGESKRRERKENEIVCERKFNQINKIGEKSAGVCGRWPDGEFGRPKWSERGTFST
jgi:hypothetical protein